MSNVRMNYPADGSVLLESNYRQAGERTEGTLTRHYGNSLAERLNQLLQRYALSSFQVTALSKLMTAFKNIEYHIEPDKLTFQDLFTGDDELILFRTSKRGATNLVIHDDELIAYSFIGKEEQPVLDFFEETKAQFDFEAIAYKFLAK